MFLQLARPWIENLPKGGMTRAKLKAMKNNNKNPLVQTKKKKDGKVAVFLGSLLCSWFFFCTRSYHVVHEVWEQSQPGFESSLPEDVLQQDLRFPRGIPGALLAIANYRADSRLIQLLPEASNPGDPCASLAASLDSLKPLYKRAPSWESADLGELETFLKDLMRQGKYRPELPFP